MDVTDARILSAQGVAGTTRSHQRPFRWLDTKSLGNNNYRLAQGNAMMVLMNFLRQSVRCGGLRKAQRLLCRHR